MSSIRVSWAPLFSEESRRFISEYEGYIARRRQELSSGAGVASLLCGELLPRIFHLAEPWLPALSENEEWRRAFKSYLQSPL